MKKFLAIAMAMGAVSACSVSASDHANATKYEEEYEVLGPQTKGHKPEKGFLVRFDEPFDPKTQYLADYPINEPWISTHYIPANHRRQDGVMELKVERRQYGRKPHTGGEFHRSGFYGYGRYEVVMQAARGEGVVSAFFTHTFILFDDPHDEIDIEFLGKNTRQAHLNHFKDGVPAGSTYIDLPFDAADDYHLYAFEWEPDKIRWYVDDVLVYETTHAVPDHSGRVISSAWVGGPAAYGWLGKPNFEPGTHAKFTCMSHLPIQQVGEQCSDTYFNK